MDPHGRDPVPETLEKFSVQWYIKELRALFAAADVAQQEQRPEAGYAAKLLQTLASGFLQPDQIQQHYAGRTIDTYRAKVPTLTRGTEDYFVAAEIGRWLRVCDEAIVKGASPLRISAIIRPIIEQRLSAVASATPEPEPASEQRERSYRYEIGEHSEASTAHPDLNEDTSLVDQELELFAVFDGNSSPPGGNIVSIYSKKFIQREFKKLPPNQSPEQYQTAMVDILRRTSDYINQLKLTQVPVNVRNPDGRGYHTELQDFDNSALEGIDKAGATAAIVKMWHGPNGERKAIIGNVGDSRVYKRKTDGTIALLTVDHGDREIEVDGQKVMLSTDRFKELLQKFARTERRGQFSSPEEQAFLKSMNTVTQGLGGYEGAGFRPDVLIVDLAPGEELLLTSDGIHDQISDTQIERTTAAFTDVSDAANVLVRRSKAAGEQALVDADARGKGPDDATAVLIREMVTVQPIAPEQPAAQETPAARLQKRIERELANPEVWGQYENPFVQEAIGRLTEEERKFVITGAMRLAADLMGGLVVVSKPFQHERAKKVASDAKLNQLSPAARHEAIARVPFSGLEHEWNVDVSPQRKVFGGKQTFGEVLKDNKTVAALFGANSPFGEALLNYASQQEDVFAMALLPVTDRPYAVIYNKWPVPSNSTPVEHRPSGHETLFGVSLDGVGKAQELFSDPVHAYLLPLIMQLAASKVSERGAYYFDAPFGNHVFREPSSGQKLRPNAVMVANCLTKQRLECKDMEAGSVAEVTSYPTLDKLLAASRTSYYKRESCFSANIKRAQGR